MGGGLCYIVQKRNPGASGVLRNSSNRMAPWLSPENGAAFGWSMHTE